MGFNYGKEKRRFDAEWLILAEQYRTAGFYAAGIDAMRDFDWELFKKRRTYENRTQALPSENICGDDCENRSTLLIRFSALTASFDESAFGRYGWIETISDSGLTDKLNRLSQEDKELLTLFVFDEYTQAEIAVMQGCSQQAVSKKIKRIKNRLM